MTPMGQKLTALSWKFPEHQVELIGLRDRLEAAIANGDVKNIVGNWARARRRATEIAGVHIMEDLL